MAKLALEAGISQEYRCANNILKCDLLFNVDPNAPWNWIVGKQQQHWCWSNCPCRCCPEVPIRAAAIDNITKFHYAEPNLFQEPFEVTVQKSWVNGMQSQDVKPVVPIEHVMAFILLLSYKKQSGVTLAHLLLSRAWLSLGRSTVTWMMRKKCKPGSTRS